MSDRYGTLEVRRHGEPLETQQCSLRRLSGGQIGDLYCDGSLKSFGDLARQFNIPVSHFFKYLQIQHMLVGIFGSGASAPQTAEFLDKIIKSYGKGHEAAVYYSMLIQTLGNGPISALQRT